MIDRGGRTITIKDGQVGQQSGKKEKKRKRDGGTVSKKGKRKIDGRTFEEYTGVTLLYLSARIIIIAG